MIKDIIKSAVQFIVLLLCQVLILNNVYFLGYINPMLYVWFIIMLPFSTPKWLVLVASFLMGVCVDVLGNDVGVHAAVCVLIAFIRPALLNVSSNNIDKTSLAQPSVATMGFKNFLLFIVLTVAVHHLLYFVVEIFSFGEILQILLRTLLSSVVTIALILLFDMLFFKKKE